MSGGTRSALLVLKFYFLACFFVFVVCIDQFVRVSATHRGWPGFTFASKKAETLRHERQNKPSISGGVDLGVEFKTIMPQTDYVSRNFSFKEADFEYLVKMLNQGEKIRYSLGDLGAWGDVGVIINNKTCLFSIIEFVISICDHKTPTMNIKTSYPVPMQHHMEFTYVINIIHVSKDQTSEKHSKHNEMLRFILSAVSYFGFRQNLQEIRRFSARKYVQNNKIPILFCLSSAISSLVLSFSHRYFLCAFSLSLLPLGLILQAFNIHTTFKDVLLSLFVVLIPFCLHEWGFHFISSIYGVNHHLIAVVSLIWMIFKIKRPKEDIAASNRSIKSPKHIMTSLLLSICASFSIFEQIVQNTKPNISKLILYSISSAIVSVPSINLYLISNFVVLLGKLSSIPKISPVSLIYTLLYSLISTSSAFSAHFLMILFLKRLLKPCTEDQPLSLL